MILSLNEIAVQLRDNHKHVTNPKTCPSSIKRHVNAGFSNCETCAFCVITPRGSKELLTPSLLYLSVSRLRQWKCLLAYFSVDLEPNFASLACRTAYKAVIGNNCVGQEL